MVSFIFLIYVMKQIKFNSDILYYLKKLKIIQNCKLLTVVFDDKHGKTGLLELSLLDSDNQDEFLGKYDMILFRIDLLGMTINELFHEETPLRFTSSGSKIIVPEWIFELNDYFPSNCKMYEY